MRWAVVAFVVGAAVSSAASAEAPEPGSAKREQAPPRLALMVGVGFPSGLGLGLELVPTDYWGLEVRASSIGLMHTAEVSASLRLPLEGNGFLIGYLGAGFARDNMWCPCDWYHTDHAMLGLRMGRGRDGWRFRFGFARFHQSGTIGGPSGDLAWFF